MGLSKDMGLSKGISLSKLKTYADLVMFSHTLFSLPFAVIAMLWAAGGIPKFTTVFWILVALAGARNGANAINRLVDRKIDAKNPRTADRHMPKGSVKTAEVWVIIIVCFALMLIAAIMLNPLCVMLLPLAIFGFALYSYTKRFTWACHIVLGIACGGAPVGAWIAVRGEIGWPSLVLGAVVTLWVAGFDIIYGTQDVEFDRKEGLYSIPAYFGVRNALIISALFHIAAVGLLVYLHILMNTGWLYLVGLAVVSGLLALEHIMVSPNNLRNVRIASYNINQVVGMSLLVFVALDILLA